MGTTTYTATASDAYGCTASDSALVTVIPPAPFAFEAQAVTPTQVNLSWQFTGTADTFHVYRNGSFLASTTNTSYSDVSALFATAYMYDVRAVKSGTSSVGNPRDLATTVMLSSIVPRVTVVSAVHLTELQSAVNAVRHLAGRIDFAYTPGVAPGLPIKAIHIQELRSALDEARGLLVLPAVVYAFPATAGTTIHTTHVTDIQGGVK